MPRSGTLKAFAVSFSGSVERGRNSAMKRKNALVRLFDLPLYKDWIVVVSVLYFAGVGLSIWAEGPLEGERDGSFILSVATFLVPTAVVLGTVLAALRLGVRLLVARRRRYSDEARSAAVRLAKWED